MSFRISSCVWPHKCPTMEKVTIEDDASTESRRFAASGKLNVKELRSDNRRSSHRTKTSGLATYLTPCRGGQNGQPESSDSMVLENISPIVP
jgi:hypothetical protein